METVRRRRRSASQTSPHPRFVSRRRGPRREDRSAIVDHLRSRRRSATTSTEAPSSTTSEAVAGAPPRAPTLLLRLLPACLRLSPTGEYDLRGRHTGDPSIDQSQPENPSLPPNVCLKNRRRHHHHHHLRLPPPGSSTDIGLTFGYEQLMDLRDNELAMRTLQEVGVFFYLDSIFMLKVFDI